MQLISPIRGLCRQVDSYLDAEIVQEIFRAYEFGAKAHAGQHRASGEPYIHHPVRVAQILADMHMDPESLVAAILHDVIEDTPTAKEDVVGEFGEAVGELVDGVSKLTHLTFESKEEAQAENFRKMLLAMSRDIRVILVKLADRLHNMRTLGVLRPEKRRQIARETLDIYCPIANRLGLNNIRLELEDLGFQALYPNRYRVLSRAVKRARGHRKQVVKKILTAIRRRLRQEGLAGNVIGREKHLYSLYNKMHRQGLSFSEVMDVYAFRIIVSEVDTCYRVLGAVHNLYKPVPGKFKDYVALPKANGYQSLHTVLFGPYGVPIEVQIRTEDMHAVAESGIAAHWLYKTHNGGVNAAQKRAHQWLRELLELHKQAGDSAEFIEHLKVDLFPDEVYVFTPAGDIIELARGATAVDLAYAIHTDVGNTCVAAKVDRRYVPLQTQLETGQTVEVVTAPWGQPNPGWLNFVVTGKARANIRNRLKSLRSHEAIELGQRLLEQVLKSDDTALEQVPAARLHGVVEEFGLQSFDDLLEEIGLGTRVAAFVARKLVDTHDHDDVRDDVGRTASGEPAEPLPIMGSEGLVVTFGRCCHPIPGDPILGFVSAGRGLVIHTRSCKNVSEFLNRPEKWVHIDWAGAINREFPVEIRLDIANVRGVLATIAAGIADQDANIDNVVFEDRDGLNSSLKFVVEVKNRVHLANIMRKLRDIKEVNRITRTRG
ncbi:MAG: bifunctional GTP diphosphokinase/guanosine-3',5'-bis(diphosphate) 3'-diphosphatase [Thiotrichales bacterium]|nr:bifunctional GTP diphosphokinase/guanosine-3',5'-bis(diphosphate) 3'-diphosphatase [Thiotrichales bacterium]